MSVVHLAPLRISLRALLLALLAAGFALPAVAQDKSGIDEIVVTARKREESLQDTPLSVSAFSEEMIEDLGISSTDDIASIAPNTYVFQPPGGATSLVISMRGVASAEPLLTVDSGVAIYVDGAYLARGASSAIDIVDLARVEVLRGPQGTLYGRNATGGAINFITKQPADDMGLRQDFSIGRFGRFESRTVLETGEISDSGFKASLTYQHQERDGWMNNLNAPDDRDPDAFNGDNFRFAANWDASENLNLRYSYDNSDFDTTRDFFHIFGLSAGVENALRSEAASVTNLGQATTELTALGTNPAYCVINDCVILPLRANSDAFTTALADAGTDLAALGEAVAEHLLPRGDYDTASVGNTGRPKTISQPDGVAENEISAHNLSIEYAASPDLTIKSITTYREWEQVSTDGDLGPLGGLATNNVYKVFANPAYIGDATVNPDSITVADLGQNIDITTRPNCAGANGWLCVASGFPQASTAITDGSLFTATNRRTHEQFSQELQFLGDLESLNLDYVVGVYYFQEEGTERNPQQFLAATPFLDGNFNTWEFIDFTGPEQTVLDDGVVQGGLSNFAYDAESESWAVFGSVNWQVDERISVSAGLRYSRDDKDLLLIGVKCGANTPSNPNDDTNCPTGKNDIAESADFDHVDYDASITYAVNDDINVYLRYATAYLSGGFNPRANQLGVDYRYEEEELGSVEAGVKALLLDNRLQINSSVFFSQYEDIQTQSFLAGSGGAASITDNAGEAEFLGVEVELLAQPTDYLTLYLNYGYVDMKYNSFVVQDPGVVLKSHDATGAPLIDPQDPATFASATACGSTGWQVDGGFCTRIGAGPIDLANLPGFEPPFSYRPESTLSAGAEFSRELGTTGVDFSARVDVRRVEDIGDWTATPNCWPSGAPATPFAAAGVGTSSRGPCDELAANPDRAYLGEKGFTVVDARITFSNIRITDEKHAQFSLWAKNLTDEEYIRSGIDFGGLGFGGVSWGAPATFGLDMSFEF